MWFSEKESACQCRRHVFDPWVKKIPLEEEMATRSSTLAWRIPWTKEPGGLQSIGSQTLSIRSRGRAGSKEQIKATWEVWGREPSIRSCRIYAIRYYLLYLKSLHQHSWLHISIINFHLFPSFLFFFFFLTPSFFLKFWAFMLMLCSIQSVFPSER